MRCSAINSHRPPRSAALAGLLALAVAGVVAAAPLPSAESLIASGLKAYKEGNLKAAAAELKKAVNLKPDALDAHYYLGRIGLLQKDLYTAFWSFKEVLALQKDYKSTPALFRQLQTPLLEQVKSELKVNPRSARAYNVLGFLLLYQKRPNEGITQLNYALKFDPSLATAYDDLAWAYYQTNRFDTALKYSERAFTLDPVRASITRHYQQLFYLKRLGSSTEAGAPDRFYSSAGEEKPEATPVPADSVGPEPPPTSAQAEPREPPIARPTQPPDQPVQPEQQPTLPPEEPPADASAAATPDLTRITIDDTAIVNAFLKDFKPKPAPGSRLPTQTALVVPSGPPKDPPPSAAEIATRVRALYKKGKDLAAKTDFDGALQAFELLIQVDPTYRDSRTQLETMRRYARAKKNFDQAMDFYQSGSYAAALELLRGIDLRTLREFRNVPTLDHMVGECYHHAGRHKEAADKLAKYCEDNPADVKFRYLLAKSLAELKEHRQALDQLAIIRQTDAAYLNQFPDAKSMRMKLAIKAYFPYVAAFAAIWAFVSLGYFGYKLKQTQEARRLKRTLAAASQLQKAEDWEKLLNTVEEYELQSGRAKVNDPRVRQSKALALVQLGRLDQAHQEVEQLPDDPKKQLLRAKLRLETGDTSPEAMPEYRLLLAAEPNNLKLLQLMNSILQGQGGSDEEVERVLSRLVELEPLKGEYVTQLAGIYLGRESFDAEAMKVFQKLLSEDPANARARYGVARCHFAASHFVEAIREAKQMVEYELDNARVHEILVDSYKALEMLEEGEREYRRLLSAHPGNRTLLDAINRLRESAPRPGGPISDAELKDAYQRGMRLFSEGHFREALGTLSAAFDAGYETASAGALMVRSYLKLGETGSALRVFERMDVFDQPPDEFLLALCYEMAGLYQSEGRAREALRLYNFICRNNVNYRDAFQKLEALQTAK
ncbi:MAG: tetratricopeptide repeat protein [Candidatus Wallbacteria bacterium]|nr:tetratricopeptide repeat protein [Candidatus Wallbacteria bacterium]